jgi:hypothetical protein
MVIHQNSFYDFLTTPIINPKNHIQHIQHTMLIIAPFPPTKHEKLDCIKWKIFQLPPPPTDQALQKFRTMGRDLGQLLWPANQNQTFSFTGALEGSLYSRHIYRSKMSFTLLERKIFHPKYCVQAMLLLWVEMLKHMHNLMALSRS